MIITMNNRRLAIIIPILIASIIFFFSSFGADGSNAQSGFVVNLVTSIVPNLTDLNLVTTIVRKAAHFTEYALLGFFTARAFAVYEKKLTWSAAICIAYSVTDELHQLIVPGRSCEIVDVLIDSAGITFGTILYYATHR